MLTQNISHQPCLYSRELLDASLITDKLQNDISPYPQLGKTYGSLLANEEA